MKLDLRKIEKLSGIQVTFLIQRCFLFLLTSDSISLCPIAHGKSCLSIPHMLYISPFRKVDSIFVSVLYSGGEDCDWPKLGPSTALRINKESLNKWVPGTHLYEKEIQREEGLGSKQSRDPLNCFTYYPPYAVLCFQLNCIKFIYYHV